MVDYEGELEDKPSLGITLPILIYNHRIKNIEVK